MTRDNLAALMAEMEAEYGPIPESAIRAALAAWFRCECGGKYRATRDGVRIHNGCPGPKWSRNEIGGWRPSSRALERANLAELLDDMEATNGPVPQEEVDRALATWPDSAYPPRSCCDSVQNAEHERGCPKARDGRRGGVA